MGRGRWLGWQRRRMALGSAFGRCQVDRRVRARRAQRLGRQIESILPYIARAPFLGLSLRDRMDAWVAGCDFANAAE